MKQFIINRIKELETTLSKERNQVKQIDDLPFYERSTEQSLKKKRLMNNKINSIEVAIRLNNAVLVERASNE